MVPGVGLASSDYFGDRGGMMNDMYICGVQT